MSAKGLRMNIISASIAAKLPKLHSSPVLIKKKKSSKTRTEEVPLFNIPSAVPRRKLQQVDIYFDKKKKALEHKLPILTAEDIKRLRLPYRIYLIQKLSEEGCYDVARELEFMMRKEELAILDLQDPQSVPRLANNQQQLNFYAQQLQICSQLVSKGKHHIAFSVRQALAEELLLKGDKIWLAKHFYETCAEISEQISPDELRGKCESETKCILGYLELDQAEENDWALKNAMSYFEQSRELSRGQHWEFQSKVLILRLKKPVHLLSLRQDYDIIHGRTMTIYGISTLLLYESLSMRASSIVFSSSPQNQDLGNAYDCAREAIKMADESGNSTAMSSAFMVLGTLHLQRGELAEALELFERLQGNAELRQDFESEAIAFNMLGCTYLGLNDPINALENFVRQKEIADEKNIRDLHIDALQNIGRVLLDEGQAMEAEECFACAQRELQSLEQTDRLLNHDRTIDNVWVMFAITAGMNMWGRLSGHCRKAGETNLDIITKWKGYRRPMDMTQLPPSEAERLAQVFPHYQPSSRTKLPSLSPSDVETFLAANGRLVDGLSDNGVPYDAYATSSAADLMAQNRLKLQMAAAREPKVKFESLDRGHRVLYDSDLRGTVQKLGHVYKQGESVWTLMTINAKDSDSDSIIAVADGPSGTIMQKVSALERNPSQRHQSVLAHKSILINSNNYEAEQVYPHSKTSRLHRAATKARTVKTLAQMDRGSLWQMSRATVFTMNRIGGESRLPLAKASMPEIPRREHVPENES